jgi:L-lactate dehydrogenase complex protein LldG
MTDDREQIMSRVRSALAPLTERAALPDYDGGLAIMRKLTAGRDLTELFAERLKAVNGFCFTDPAELVARLREGKWMHGYCDPALWPALKGYFGEGFTVETEYDRTRIDDFAFGITRAAGAIAETGTIVLQDGTTVRRLAALTPWVHVAYLRREDIYPDLAEAVSKLGPDRNTIWATGPSKTADVEGILIQGVHGPGAQYALIA